MKFFIDSANLSEIKEVKAQGLIDGVTTNPTLVAKEGREFKKLIYEMRFDEVSARYGDFGTFFVGNLLQNEKLAPCFFSLLL